MPVTDTGRETGLQNQFLATGAAGGALLAIEQAMTGAGDWATAARGIRRAGAGDIDASDRAGLYYGAPAIRFVLCAAQADGLPRYHQTARTLDHHITRLVHRRMDAAV